jgi:hypothetical protein
MSSAPIEASATAPPPLSSQTTMAGGLRARGPRV